MRAWMALTLAGLAVAAPSTGIAKDNPTLELSSAELKDGKALPKSATCDGAGKSPALAWKGNAAAKSFAMITDDPDAPKGPYVHWVLFDIPRDTTSIAHGGSAGVVGTNSADQRGFAPACPPQGSGVHHYRFHLYALDVGTLGASSGATRADIDGAMKGHVVAEATLTGTYERR